MGKFLIVLLCLGATVLSIPAVSPYGLNNWISLAASSTAFVAMALNQYLATRPRLLEPLFGGLDRMYHFHRQIGIAALLLILVHYFVEPDFRGLQLTAELNSLARDAGEIGFYGLIALIALSLVKRIPLLGWEIPYNLWRQSHRLMGVFFIFIAFHWFFVKRPFGGDALLANYLTAFGILGILSFLYTQFIAFTKTRLYKISKVTKLPAATVIEAEPFSKAIKARPGQFGFLHFAKSGLREPHPFTIAGTGRDGSIRFAIKPSGDFTNRLRQTAEVGDRIYVEGGYGRFVHSRGGDRQIWLAGGIGITPFLAMSESLGKDEKRKIHLVHCVKNADEAVDRDKLIGKSAELDSFSYHVHNSKDDGRIDAAKLVETVPFEVNGADLWFCGPPGLRNAIVKGLKKAGNKLRRVEFERFEFR
ncbi:MAG: ferric reductase-like transmembrane domain-containing protein [Pseudomonadota bacterium]